MTIIVRDNVQLELKAGIDDTQTTVTFKAAVSPFSDPPQPGNGEEVELILTDQLSAPTKLEKLTATSIVDDGSGDWQCSVTRGDSPATFDAGAIALLAPTAALVDQLTWITAHRIQATNAPASGRVLRLNDSLQFEWVDFDTGIALSLESVSPSSGHESGGSSVTLAGTFDSGASSTAVSFGGASATNVAVIDGSTITCDTPSGTAGTVDIVVTQDGNSATLVDAFEYTSSATYADTINADNPIGYWRFEDLSTIAVDEIGSNDGNLGVGTTSGTSVVSDSSQSADFDGGSDSAITIPTDSSIKPTGDKLSVEAWINTADGTSDTRRIIEFENGGPWIILGVKNGVVRWTIDTGSPTDLDGTIRVDDGNDHHIVGTYDGTTMRIYVNGTEDVNTSKSGNIDWTSGDDVVIGSDNPKQNSKTFNGQIDEVAIYDSALTAAQVSDHYNAGTA